MSSSPTDDSISTSDPATDSFAVEARSIFRRWEYLRLWYNGILVVWTLVWIGSLAWASIPADMALRQKMLRSFVGFALFGGIVANLCYFAGPILESYLTWLGVKPPRLRLGLFAVGTLFTMCLAWLTILGAAFTLLD